MLHWDYVWKPHRDELMLIAPENRHGFLVSAMLDAWHVLGVGWRETLDDNERKILEPAVVDASVASAPIRMDEGHLESLAEDSSSPGFYDFGTGLLNMLKCQGSETGKREMTDILSYYYQAVLDVEIISQLKRPTLEEEVRELEQANAQCLRLISGQMELLREWQAK